MNLKVFKFSIDVFIKYSFVILELELVVTLLCRHSFISTSMLKHVQIVVYNPKGF